MTSGDFNLKVIVCEKENMLLISFKCTFTLSHLQKPTTLSIEERGFMVCQSSDNEMGHLCSMKKTYCHHVAVTLRMKMHSQSPARLNGRGHQAAG